MLTLTKKKMRDAFAKLDNDGDETVSLSEMIQFERARQREDHKLLIGIYWIGFTCEEEIDDEKDILEEQKLLINQEGEDGSKFVNHYEITSLG